MGRTIVVFLSVILLATGAAFASEKGTHEGAHDEGDLQTVIGEVIDISCYAEHGAKGEGHKDCAVACLKAGQPGGILEQGTDKVYVAVSEDHVNGPNKQLIPYAAKTVEARGIVNERGGVSTINIEGIKEIGLKAAMEKGSGMEHKGSSGEPHGSRKGSGY